LVPTEEGNDEKNDEKNEKNEKNDNEKNEKNGDIEGQNGDENGLDYNKLSEKEKKKMRKQVKKGNIEYDDFKKMKDKVEVVTEKTLLEMQQDLTNQTLESGLTQFESTVDVDSKSKDIHVQAFTISYKGKALLEETSLHLAHGRKYGLIGPNGTGKSTLLRHIAQGHLKIQSHISILYVEQEVEGTSKSALTSVIEGDTERLELLKEKDTLEPLSKISSEEGVLAQNRLLEIYERLKEKGAYKAEYRASQILSGLGFTEKMKEKETQLFSGGWRMRISLARALFCKPDLLLLDEPSNHLDLDACIWLEEYLRKWKKTLVVVSHDREFLNWVCTDIIHLSHKKIGLL